MPKKSQSAPLSPAGPADQPKGIRAASKATLVQSLLRRNEGASLNDLVAATGWQLHSVRAFISGLRKRGAQVVKEKVDGQSRYRTAEGE